MILSSESEKETVARIVRAAVSSILPNLPAERVAGDKSLREQGADSVDRVEILLSIMNRLGIDEPMSNFNNIPTIDDLVDYLCRARSR